IKAARQCLEKTGTDPREIDLVLWAGEDYKEYVCWTAAINVQENIGATRAWAFDVALRCAGTPLGLKVAKDLMYANPELNTVLIAGGNTNCYLVDYRNPDHSFLFNMAPSGLALLLRRDFSENRILESEILTESCLTLDCIGMIGGSKNPPTHEDVDNLGWKLAVSDPAGMKERLMEKSLPAFVAAVRGALRRSGLTEGDIGYLCPVHSNPKAHKFILDELGVSEDRGAYLRQYGHCGHGDHIIGLEMGLKEGKIGEGTNVVFLGAGTGMAFSATVIRWGRYM
ncbi:MAG: 3-oxoacyl-ACP synthase, partial [Syntrophales bacterium]|nr:3-oxoacyl-ACP synthase [Syntrophales bacterium]